MKVLFGADHGGFHLKAHLVAFVRDRGHTIEDLGTDSADAVDYPDLAHRVARAVAEGTFDRGILVCGTGVGMSLAANRHERVRAVVCTDTFSARMSRLHNDCNVLCLGERVLGRGLAEDIVAIWLETPFEGGERHTRRVAKIDPAA